MCRYVSWLYNCMIIIVSFKKCLWKISVLISWLQTIIFIDLLYVQHPQGVSVEHDIECCLLQLGTVSNAFLRQEKKKEGEEASQKIHKMLWESWHLEHTPVQIVTLIMTEHVLQRQKTSKGRPGGSAWGVGWALLKINAIRLYGTMRPWRWTWALWTVVTWSVLGSAAEVIGRREERSVVDA